MKSFVFKIKISLVYHYQTGYKILFGFSKIPTESISFQFTLITKFYKSMIMFIESYVLCAYRLIINYNKWYICITHF